MTTETSPNPKQAVFTTTFVLHQKSPIVQVIHDEDGDWHFLGAECDLASEHVMLVSLQQMLDHDPSLAELLNLPEGTQAVRQNTLSAWKRSIFRRDN